MKVLRKLVRWWPWQLKRTAAARMRKAQDEFARVLYLNDEKCERIVRDARKSVETERQSLLRIIERMEGVSVERPEGPDGAGDYVLQLHLSRHLLDRLLAHGSDDREIECVGHLFGRRAAELLRAVNFYRPAIAERRFR